MTLSSTGGCSGPCPAPISWPTFPWPAVPAGKTFTMQIAPGVMCPARAVAVRGNPSGPLSPGASIAAMAAKS
jgi:hypothetical protein